MSESLLNLFDEEDLPKATREFAEHLAMKITENMEDVDAKIIKYAKGWSLDRINEVDKSILRLALYELMYEKETPKAVVINEALELAKKYSGDESAGFINGILGAAVV